jgi:hypothetical protein
LVRVLAWLMLLVRSVPVAGIVVLEMLRLEVALGGRAGRHERRGAVERGADAAERAGVQVQQ